MITLDESIAIFVSMWPLALLIVLLPVLLYIMASTIYLLVLAVAYFTVDEPKPAESSKLNRFAIVVPAHNEELLIGRLCESLLRIRYPRELFEIFVVADNCTDRTADICRGYPIHVPERKDNLRMGKGFALNWAIERIHLSEFDAVFIVDADNVVDEQVLQALNATINLGYQAIQCQNAVGNRSDSWFTQLLFVSRIVGNHLYHQAKYKLGLSSYLMGNGLCFKTDLLRLKGWTAFTAGEDWEYYAHLAEDGIRIGFSLGSKVFHQESRSLNQATSQRLRWASGKFHVFRKQGLRLFWKGIRQKNWYVVDTSLPLIFPNYSLQINLTVFAVVVCLLLPESAFATCLIWISLGLLGGQLLLFLLGTYLAGEYWKVFKALIFAPAFLAWKSAIDFLSLSGIYRGKRWVRTERHSPSKESRMGDIP